MNKPENHEKRERVWRMFDEMGEAGKAAARANTFAFYNPDHGAGWEYPKVTLNGETYRYRVSYIRPDVATLIDGVNGLCDGGDIDFEWRDEPGRYDWYLSRRGEWIYVEIPGAGEGVFFPYDYFREQINVRTPVFHRDLYNDDGTWIYKLSRYEGPGGAVTIPAELEIEAIGEGAFAENREPISVSLPEGLRSIGKDAFFTSALYHIVLPESLTEIGEAAFLACGLASSVTIPHGVKKLAPLVFCSCSDLISVTLPQGMESIGETVRLLPVGSFVRSTFRIV